MDLPIPGGRPTDDPKTELVAFRLAPRYLRLLQRLARRDGVSLTEALRKILDAFAATDAPTKRRGRR
jgi:hypothetical protein